MGVDAHDTRFFQEIPLDEGTGDGPGPIELNPNEFAKTGRVVVANRLRVAESLKDRVGPEDLSRQIGMLLLGCPMLDGRF